MSRFHVVVFHTGDDSRPMPTPPEALLHARAQFYRHKYQTILFIACLQIGMAGVCALSGVDTKSILLGLLGGSLALAGVSGWGAYMTRKDFIR